VIVGGVGYAIYDDALWAFDLSNGERRLVATLCGRVYATPAVAEGIAYLNCGGSGEDNAIVAIDLASGDEVWRVPVEDMSYAAPAVADGRLLVVAGTTLLVLDAATGREQWRFTTAAADIERSSPAVAGQTVYLGSFDGHLYALDVVTGAERWRFDTGEMIGANPVVLGATVAVSTHVELNARTKNGIVLYGIDATSGAKRWQVTLHPYTPQQVNWIWHLVSDGDRTLFVSTERGVTNDHPIVAVDAEDGTVRWRFEPEDPLPSSISYADGLLLVPSNRDLTALDAATGEEQWSLPLGAPAQVREGNLGPLVPVVTGGVIYAGLGHQIVALAEPL
jgi:outer membrane protein assembly factor BamB